MKFHLRSIIKTAEFWIVVLFLVRLVGITAPPLEGSHNWRQCTDLMVARNLCEGNGDLLHPMVDLHAWPDFSMGGYEVWRDENFAVIVLPANI